ncbi:helix-turn-helix domain-containing protein [Hymenobacter latericus]|uniref:helix-turn-helix domain-containing protein n=1 Tax=Hymenobacter sp. YIM 151858-1 TaxID=2987688 RepID=UPI0022269427|nr:helix-turn-helix transcriptional regulator [Hymenobacter sp. YIM 151858-1]UYZ61217.1 helix-turn-helix domain-containing protein [Hymenobacter sp. YIM 151858-1]
MSHKVCSKAVGQRLAQLREELAATSGERWPQSRVAEVVGLDKNQVTRLELGKGTIDAFVALLLFYQGRGYNLNWIVVPDNSAVSKRLPGPNAGGADVAGSLALLLRLQADLDQAVGKLRQ